MTAGDRSITIAWASNREPDLAEYRIYRADRAEDAEDVRKMAHVHTEPPDPDPAARPAQVAWTERPVWGLVDKWYRVFAVDRTDPVDPRGGGGNMSEPSAAVKGRARQIPPAPPVVRNAVWDAAHTVVRVDWQLADAFLVPRLERRLGEGWPWVVVSAALAPGTQSAMDTPPDPVGTYEYRVSARDHVGQYAVSQPMVTH